VTLTGHPNISLTDSVARNGDIATASVAVMPFGDSEFAAGFGLARSADWFLRQPKP